MHSETKLSAPGKGLPFPENLIARFLFMPMAFRRLSVERSIDLFLGEAKECIRLARTVDPELLNRPALIKRFVGIEDSSRQWSIAMTLDHLHIVGENIYQIAKLLSEGDTPTRVVKIEDVKPAEDSPKDIIERYSNFLESYRPNTANLQYPDLPTHPHPWFGKLNTAQWMKLNALHNRIHRKQIQAIIKILHSNSDTSENSSR